MSQQEHTNVSEHMSLFVGFQEEPPLSPVYGLDTPKKTDEELAVEALIDRNNQKQTTNTSSDNCSGETTNVEACRDNQETNGITETQHLVNALSYGQDNVAEDSDVDVELDYGEDDDDVTKNDEIQIENKDKNDDSNDDKHEEENHSTDEKSTRVRDNKNEIEEDDLSDVPMRESKRRKKDVSDDEATEYIVEKILAKKIDKKNRAEYLVKWEGYSRNSSTWEPLEYLIVRCKEAIKDFELRRAAQLGDRYGGVQGPSNLQSAKEKVDQKYRLNEILGITSLGNEKFLCISLVNLSEPVFIRLTVAKKMFPGKVIDFYLKHLQWVS